EFYLTRPSVLQLESAKLQLARFYRLTFQPLQACKSFPITGYSDIRGILRSADVYAEAALAIYYQKYPEQITRYHLTQAIELLQRAIDSGIQNARAFIDLAFLKSVVEGVESGRMVLDLLSKDGISIDWSKLGEIGQEAFDDIALQGFLLGINMPGAWTQLGNYVSTFLDEPHTAEMLYRYALKLGGGKDAICQTNLARFLIESKSDESSLDEAKKLLNDAGSHSDRRFTSWRSTLEILYQMKPSLRPSKKLKANAMSYNEQTHQIVGMIKFKQLRDKFKQLQSLDNDENRRGFELERLFYQLLALTISIVKPSYRNLYQTNPESYQDQIDGYFEHNNLGYRFECKWEKDPLDKNAVGMFFNKLDTVSVAGLLISMSGFTTSAVAWAKGKRNEKMILFIDGDELNLAFERQINFDELITEKRSHFQQSAEPYYKVICHSSPYSSTEEDIS
ncbi:restriction endonuclease, partial [bacterium]|nr:restriction endonuclease [bacterium]